MTNKMEAFGTTFGKLSREEVIIRLSIATGLALKILFNKAEVTAPIVVTIGEWADEYLNLTTNMKLQHFIDSKMPEVERIYLGVPTKSSYDERIFGEATPEILHILRSREWTWSTLTENELAGRVATSEQVRDFLEQRIGSVVVGSQFTSYWFGESGAEPELRSKGVWKLSKGHNRYRYRGSENDFYLRLFNEDGSLDEWNTDKSIVFKLNMNKIVYMILDDTILAFENYAPTDSVHRERGEFMTYRNFYFIHFVGEHKELMSGFRQFARVHKTWML